MKTVPLGDLIRPARVKRAGSGDFPVLSMTMHEGLVDQSRKFKKRVASDDISDYKVVNRGQLVVGFPIDEGVLDFQQQYDAGIVSPAYGIWDVKDDQLIDRIYLKRFLRSPYAMAYYKGKLRGSTARRRSLPSEIFLALNTPVPPLGEQRRIAAILDHADTLRAKRRQVITHLDQLAQAIFVDMFGDPLSDATSDLQLLGDVGGIVTGNTPSRNNAANYGDDIEWLKSDNLGGTIATPSDERLSATGRKAARVVPAGSILVTCIAGSPNSIGKASLVDREVAFNQQINAVVPNGTVDSRFLLEQFKVAPGLVRRQSTGGMKGLVSKSSFASIKVHIPPQDHQQLFAELVRRCDGLRQRHVAALGEADQLFESLQSRAFSGVL